MLPKTVKGSLHIQWKRCGKVRCRCSHGVLHGPYFALCWRAEGRQKKRYVRLEELPEISETLQQRSLRVSVLRDVRFDLKGYNND